MWAFIASFIYWLIAFAGFALLVAYLAGIWIDYTDGRDDDGLTDRLNDTLERELAEYGASADKIRILAREGRVPQRSIASMFRISQSQVSEIKNENTW
jgi:hypothetical protein